MTNDMKKHLEAVVEAVIFENGDAAKEAFHEYLTLKTKSILFAEAEDKEEDKEDKDEDKEDKKDKGDVKEDEKDKSEGDEE